MLDQAELDRINSRGRVATLADIATLTAPKRSSGPFPEQMYCGIVSPPVEVHNAIRDGIELGTEYGSYFEDDLSRVHVRTVNGRARYRVESVHAQVQAMNFIEPQDVAFCTLEWCELDVTDAARR